MAIHLFRLNKSYTKYMALRFDKCMWRGKHFHPLGGAALICVVVFVCVRMFLCVGIEEEQAHESNKGRTTYIRFTLRRHTGHNIHTVDCVKCLNSKEKITNKS